VKRTRIGASGDEKQRGAWKRHSMICPKNIMGPPSSQPGGFHLSLIDVRGPLRELPMWTWLAIAAAVVALALLVVGIVLFSIMRVLQDAA
jgi:hypothetical protein